MLIYKKDTLFMKIAIAQTTTDQGNFESNIARAADMSQQASKAGAKLIVFPEMFLFGFNYKLNRDFLNERGGAAETELCRIAKGNDICICGSVPHIESGDMLPSNRLLFIGNGGNILSHYDKIHLFGIFNENKYVKPGNEIVVSDTPVGRIGFAICYDIRFPDIFVRMAKRGAKLIIVSAAFPHPRSEHWRILCRARAIENQCFVVAVNRSGQERFGSGEVKYFGLSPIIDPWGGIVAEAEEDAENALAIADISLDDVDDIRSQIPSFSDRRDDIY